MYATSQWPHMHDEHWLTTIPSCRLPCIRRSATATTTTAATSNLLFLDYFRLIHSLHGSACTAEHDWTGATNAHRSVIWASTKCNDNGRTDERTTTSMVHKCIIWLNDYYFYGDKQQTIRWEKEKKKNKMLKSVDSWHCCWTEFSMSNKVSRLVNIHTAHTRTRVQNTQNSTLRLVQVILFASAFSEALFRSPTFPSAFYAFSQLQLPLRPLTSQTRRAVTKATTERRRDVEGEKRPTKWHTFTHI